MRNLFLTISATAAMIILAGCATSNTPMPAQKPTKTPTKAPRKVSKEVQKKASSESYSILREKNTSTTSVTRKLPATYLPGKSFIVTLVIAIKPSTPDVIIDETLPEGWTITKTSSPWNKHEGTTWRWLRQGKELKETSLSYTVLPPAIAKGIVEWKGNIKTHAERVGPILGDTTIRQGK